ncbi:MAG: dicarboxylate/amino acid:cation symporter [Phycisphaerales bacterium]|jgi:Na+/H+-dicarboxylate symporter
MHRSGALLTGLILLGLVLGAIVGEFLHAQGQVDTVASMMSWGDLILIRPLKALVIPIVLFSVLVGVTSVGDPSRLGVIGGATLVYYLSTMLAAVILGAVLVSTIRPGEGLPPETVAALQDTGAAEFERQEALRTRIEGASEMGMGGAWSSIVEQLVPANVLEEMVAMRPLGVIVFALALGLALAAGGSATAPAVRVIAALFDALMRLVRWIIWLTPIGVFLLVAGTVGRIGVAELLGPMSKYMVTVVVGLAIHGLIVLPLVLWFFARVNPFDFMWRMKRALLTAFGTDSSSATLPVTIETAQGEAGCSKRASGFVLPLGATVNMDGTALYEAVAVVFLFQLYGIDLSLTEMVVVVITATLAAVGAAGIPSAGLVTMVIVVAAVNTSLAGRSDAALPMSAIGILWGVDRILDMCRTTVNVWGDAVGARIITRIAPDEDDPGTVDAAT